LYGSMSCAWALGAIIAARAAAATTTRARVGPFVFLEVSVFMSVSFATPARHVSAALAVDVRAVDFWSATRLSGRRGRSPRRREGLLRELEMVVLTAPRRRGAIEMPECGVDTGVFELEDGRRELAASTDAGAYKAIKSFHDAR
jgi:hypothetical protein